MQKPSTKSNIIIHSKYFSISDWLKPDQIWKTFALLNQKCSKVADFWTVNREHLWTRLSCFGSEYKNGGTFHWFYQQEIGKLLTKNIVRRQLKGWHLLFGEHFGAEQPIIP